ncbi:MAG: Holliday junction resolvase RuvX [Bacteroidetes bacterium]|nr:Holliday junction resolvase RuvX [Bacteroidota bacterium]
MSPQYFRYLAIDLGAKRIGLAHTDLLRTIASPLETISNDMLWSRLDQLIETEEYRAMVIGWPLESDGNEGPSIERVRKFLLSFSKRYPNLKVHKVDERYSSKEAAQVLIDSGTSKKKRQEKGRLDRIAAAIILQRYLDHHN